MKKFYISKYSNLTEKNFENLKHFFEDKLHHFIALTSLRNEILECLMLEQYQASIFAINHFLERIIKLALIEKHNLNLNFSNEELYNEKTLEAVDLYDNKKLYNTLELAKKEKLITEEEHIILDDLRDKVRNPFSHAEIKRILVGSPEKFTGYMFNINEVRESLKKGEPIKKGEKKEITTLSSALSQLYQENYSHQIAMNYFKTVYSIMKNIENRLNKMKTST